MTKTCQMTTLPFLVILFYSQIWSNVAGQTCSQIQLNSTIACYANLKNKWDNLLNIWPESNVLPNISNAWVADICKTYLNATACVGHAPCVANYTVTQITELIIISDYLCTKQNTTFLSKSDCIQNVRNSNNQSVQNCNSLTTAVSAMKPQMTTVNMCDYYSDTATCAYNTIQGQCGNDTATALTGLFDLVAQQKFANCSLAQCAGSNNYCQWGQSCRSTRACACSTICPQMNDPTCANNGLNYANPCLMRNDACSSSTWLIRRPLAYCDIHSTNPTVCTDQSVDTMFTCASPLYTSLLTTLTTTGSFLFAATNQQLTNTCSIYTTFKSCLQNSPGQCAYQNFNILKQFYDYLCSSQGNSEMTSSVLSACRQALSNDSTTSACVKNYNSTLNGLAYYQLKQYTFSISEEMPILCSSTNDLYHCASPRIQTLCDQNSNTIFNKLFNGTFDIFQQNCNQGCKSTMTDVYGVISTSNWPYGRNAGVSKCTWHIKVPNGLSVSLMIYPNRPFDCQEKKSKFISVYSGDTDNSSNLIADFCSSSITAAKTISTSQTVNRMTVVYSSIATDGTRAPDFLAMYYAGMDACSTNPCGTSATCVNEIGGYLCRNSNPSANPSNSIHPDSNPPNSAGAQHDPMCNAGYTLYMNMCYMATKTPVPIDQPTAELACRSGGAHLTAITSSTENDFITQLAARLPANTIWTGLRWEDNTRWKWLSQDSSTFTAWNTGQPINATAQRCVVLNAASNGRWETRQCYPATADAYVCRVSPTDYCNPNPCLNGGTCVSTTTGAYCRCTTSYTGVICDQQSSACANNPCQNGATCTDLGNSQYQCNCVPGYMGTTCSININECASNPCLNGGICVDGVNQYTCRCSNGYTGINCATSSNPCSTNPCQNGGTCSSTSATAYSCSCPTGFSGSTCSAMLDPCYSGPCQNGATCNRTSSGGFVCFCAATFSGPTCSIMSACASNPCLNGGTCTNTASTSTGYTCSCASGFSGGRCEIGTAVSPCASGPCINGGTCSNSGGTFTCACILGYSGVRCETNINECASNPCQNGGTCVDGLNEFNCLCAKTWSGATCTQKINNCSPNPCRHQGTCVILSETEYICKCADGWVGIECEADNNECDYYPCSANATCVNTPGSFYCSCPIGTNNCFAPQKSKFGSGKGSGCASSPCHNGGTCQANGNGFSCTCPPEYNGTTCDTALCDSGWKYNQGYCYTVTTSTMSNNDGQKYCIQRSADLASVRSLDERDFIGKQMAAQNVDRVWIGARVKSGAWSWIDGVSWGYTSWYTSEPKDNSSTACARMITGYGFSWDTESCDKTEPSVCKKLAYGGQNFCSAKPCLNNGACINLADHYECSCMSGYSGLNCETGIVASRNGSACTNGFTGSTCATPCPSGWSWSNSVCYFGVNVPATYDQAVIQCPQKQSGSYLLTTQTQAEFDYTGILMNQLQSNVWLGLKYITSQSQFIWVTGAVLGPNDFKSWGTNQPASQQTMNCVRITGSTGFIWETFDCNRSLRYICKYKG